LWTFGISYLEEELSPKTSWKKEDSIDLISPKPL